MREGGSRITLTPMISIRHEAEARLNDLLKTRGNLTSLMDAKVKLSQLYDRVLENVQHSTPEIKALALDALDIKVYAQGTDNVEIQGVIPLELPTIARTLGSLFNCRYSSILMAKGMLYQERNHNNNQFLPFRVCISS